MSDRCSDILYGKANIFMTEYVGAVLLGLISFLFRINNAVSKKQSAFWHTYIYQDFTVLNFDMFTFTHLNIPTHFRIRIVFDKYDLKGKPGQIYILDMNWIFNRK